MSAVRDSSAPVIGFLSDYGREDEFVGVCHGVIARRCPQARVIDLTHAIPRHDVRAGALVLRAALPYIPSCVQLAVVDPGVGAGGAQARRAVALRSGTGGQLLVGPDNGLLMPAAESLGGVAQVVDVGHSSERLEPVSATFHGRDIFAPVAAALAAGAALGELGEPIPVESLQAIALPQAQLRGRALTAHVLRCDTFGNLILDAHGAQLGALDATRGRRLSVEHAGSRHVALRGRAFADAAPGELVVYEDAEGMVALAVNRGSAAQLLGADRDDELVISPA
jgi:S-adenosyl-L-methionine hydrolase (adenosine-forming)